MNMDHAIKTGSRKNIMISIKANPVQENYYNNPRPNVRKIFYCLPNFYINYKLYQLKV